MDYSKAPTYGEKYCHSYPHLSFSYFFPYIRFSLLLSVYWVWDLPVFLTYSEHFFLFCAFVVYLAWDRNIWGV